MDSVSALGGIGPVFENGPILLYEAEVITMVDGIFIVKSADEEMPSAFVPVRSPVILTWISI